MMCQNVLFAALFAVCVAQDAPIINLGYAKYQGSFDPSRNLTSFLGMKYAAPPTGELRFRAPHPPLKVEGVQVASSLGPACINSGAGAGSPTNPYTGEGEPKIDMNFSDNDALAENSEDCLTLSVFTPGHLDPSNLTELLPVVFWIHGGGYIFGNGGDRGDDLVEESGYNSVAVVLQYRLGLFGFLAGQAVKDGGDLNAGLLDQQFALKWTQKHIAKFGGDPSRVTIWGESAGAGSVLQQVIANQRSNPPLFRAAITSSTFLPSQYYYNDPIPEQLYRIIVAQAGCSGARKPLDCLRGLSTSSLTAINTAVNAAGFVGTFVTVPVVDGTFITERASAKLKKGIHSVNGHVVLAATNADEGGPFVDHNPVVPHTVEGYLLNLFPLLSDKSLRRAVKAYSKVGSVLDQVIAIMNESIFVCPSYYLLDAFSGAAFKGELAVPPAKHGDDIAYYFPSFGIVKSFSDPDFSKAFVESFTSFFLNLNPNAKISETITPPWAQWLGRSPVEMLFNKTESGLPVVEPIRTSKALFERCAFWESVGEETGQ